MDSHRPPPQQAHATTSRHGRAVEKLKSVVMKCAMASAPGQRSRALIEKRIHELVVLSTPHSHHPPYAWMIENAIKELNEEGGGSDEKAISKFILEEYKDLPWAHPAFLNHHLKSLSKTGNLTQNHGKLRISCSPSPSPVSSSSPTSTYAPSDSSASSQSYVQKRTRKKKKKKRNYKTKRPRQKKHINARGCDDGEKMKQVFTGQVGSDICLDDGMGEVDIISLLTEDEDEANIIQAQAQVDDQSHLHHTRTQTQQQQQQIIVFQHEHEQNMGDQDDCSTPTPTTFPEKTKRIRNSSCGKRSESNMNGVDEQVYTDLRRQEQQQESANNKALFQQNHYCPKPKPRPRPYRNVVDIYESSSTATRNTN